MLTILRAASCTGKSTYAAAHYDPANIISSDQLRELLCGTRSDQHHNSTVFQYVASILQHRLKVRTNHTVIDATNLRYKEITQYLDLAEKYHVPVEIISFVPPSLPELLERNLARNQATGFYIPEAVIERQLDCYYSQLPTFLANQSRYQWTEYDYNH